MEISIDKAGGRHDGGCGLLVLRLGRIYHADGTDGIITLYGKTVCHSIELPWCNNRWNVSCIPEGRYRPQDYRSRRFGRCLLVADVPGVAVSCSTRPTMPPGNCRAASRRSPCTPGR